MIRLKLILLFALLNCLLNLHSKPLKSLRERMWEKADGCYSAFDDLDEDGVVDYNEMIDDTRNGYLMVSGSWPTCECGCITTVGAYRDNNGVFTLLEQEYWNCSWVRRLTSDRKLADILPDQFGISSFIPQAETTETEEYARFYVEAEIPRNGTDTKITIKPVPIGLYMKSRNLLTFEIYEYSWREREDYNDPNTKSLYEVKMLTSSIQNKETLEHILNGNFDIIIPHDLALIDEILNSNTLFHSRTDLQRCLLDIKLTFDLYTRIESETIILAWDKEKSCFYIREKGKRPTDYSFIEFLQQVEFWTGIC